MKKNTIILLALTLSLTLSTALAQQCPHYTHLLQEGDAKFKASDFRGAINKYQAAITDCPERAGEVQPRVLMVFDRIEELRNEAETSRKHALAEAIRADSISNAKEQAGLTAFANDLALKSKSALGEFDRNTAFRLAEFAQRYVEPDNPQVVRAMVNALYYNDVPKREYVPVGFNLDGHLAEVVGMAWAQSNRYILTASLDGVIRLWKPSDGFKLEKEYELGFSIKCMSLTQNGNFAVFGGREFGSAKAIICIVDVSNGKIIRRRELPYRAINSIACAPSGKFFVATFGDSLAVRSELPGQKPDIILDGHHGEVLSVAISNDEKYVATTSKDSTCILWNAFTGEIIRKRKLPSITTSVDFSPFGDSIAIGTDNQQIMVWNRMNWAIEYVSCRNAIVSEIKFSPKSEFLAFANGNQITLMHESDQILNMRLVNHPEQVTDLDFSPDNKFCVSSSRDGTAKVWPLKRELAAATFKCEFIALDSNSSQLLLYQTDGSRGIVNVEDPKNFTATGLNSIDSSNLSFPNFSADGNRIFGVLEIKSRGLSDFYVDFSTFNHPQDHCIQISPQDMVVYSNSGNLIAILQQEQEIILINKQLKECKVAIHSASDRIISFAISPDDKSLAFSLDCGIVKIMNLENGFVSSIDKPGCPSSFMTFTPDGHFLALGGPDSRIKIWDLHLSKVTKILVCRSEITAMAFSPIHAYLAVGFQDGHIEVWDYRQGEKWLSIHGYRSQIQFLGFASKGKKLVSWAGNEAKIWELNCEGLISRWKELYGTIDLPFENLKNLEVGGLLSISDFERKLFASGEAWQIKAFADLAVWQTHGSSHLLDVNNGYAQAERLYQKALSLLNEKVIRRNYARMLRLWADSYRSAGLDTKATELEIMAIKLWPKE